MRCEGSAQRVAAGSWPPAPASIDLIGASETFRSAQLRVAQVAATTASVLLLGETGTGKSVTARAIHDVSARAGARFISVDCASLPPALIESELFGREKGAFTGAHAMQIGRFELAHGGTIFLDEIGDLPPEAQSKLLRVLQQGEFERLGSPRTIKVDVRVIAATNRVLSDEVKAGRFRRDLYYRLSVFPITLPPLRERVSDIPALTRHLVDRLGRKHQRRIVMIPKAVLETLSAHDWPGNVRELENVLERAVITSPDSTLRLLDFPAADTVPDTAAPVTTMLVDVERAHILRVLEASAWRIEGACGAAAILGLKASTLRSRMLKLGVQRTPVDAMPAASRAWL